MNSLKSDAVLIFNEAVRAMLPERAVREALCDFAPCGRVVLIAVGKAAWEMAHAAIESLGEKISCGCVVTKYGHSRGALAHPCIEIFESGHPVPDEQSVAAGRRVLEMTSSLAPCDTVLFLVSGGGSALFEVPLPEVLLSDIEDLTKQLLAKGADIVEINTLRKRLSAVKGGRFAKHCAPASVYQITLSDVIGDRMDSIASGPAWPDSTTCRGAEEIISRYGINIPPRIMNHLRQETPKKLNNVSSAICGNVRELCLAAKKAAENLGYAPYILSSSIACEARELGLMAGAMARDTAHGASCFEKPCAVIMGGESVVHIKGTGRGGRNQETALAAAMAISGTENAAVLSGGSDGTDGPTDAAGGIVCGKTWNAIKESGHDPLSMLENNDSHEALKCADSLLVTGPTGTNVNDIVIILVK